MTLSYLQLQAVKLTNQPVKRSRKLGEFAAGILKHAKNLPEGGIVSAKEFLHLGTRSNVDQALSRLARRGELLRVGRGLYTRPVKSRFGLAPPLSGAILKSLSELTSEAIVPSGAASANILGLTTQIPMREVYLTQGPARSIHLGSRRIELRHAPRWLVREGTVGNVIRALNSFGEKQAEETLNQLWSKLGESEKKELLESRVSVPSWMASAISIIGMRDKEQIAA